MRVCIYTHTYISTHRGKEGEKYDVFLATSCKNKQTKQKNSEKLLEHLLIFLWQDDPELHFC